MLPEVWATLPPYQRDAVRIGFINYTPPAGAGRWPETEFGWGILLNRFANARRIEELWTPGPAPVTIEERTARGAYEVWKLHGSKAFKPRRMVVKKNMRHSPKKVLTWISNGAKKVFSKATFPVASFAKAVLTKLRTMNVPEVPPRYV